MTGVCYGTYDDTAPEDEVYTAHDGDADEDTSAMASTSAEWTYT